ncbi:DNase I-like protein [Sodiomyces alkalinus F11]|uniref:DNase I-like protein n=1 Tax=Sodiomyces alkalinus (strain CBS 110278 / VKM F-3762 / F11) TaxID=1314773 RepID=A0A3N2PLZ6_SODAK|nr:DNase I-like protein [Sodiomyces alkalinus F11]ROT35376.1 DNase I-like protein [Sodiomyces alkalinus F11]
MAPSTLDLFILTFNCAKNFINAGVFASHLQTAFQQNATTLPEVVVISLQEVAPMSYSFIGGYFLSPYLARFEEAINLAAAKFASHSHTDNEDEPAVIIEPTVAPVPVRPYTLVRTRNVGMTAIMLFARDPTAIQSVEEAEAGFGAAEMGNKGAAGLRMLYDSQDQEPGVGPGRSSELTFVATHLAAMEWNLPRRNANWAAIMRGLTFGNPEEVLKQKRKAIAEAASATGEAGAPSSRRDEEEDDADSATETSDEGQRLLQDEDHALDVALRAQLHDLSVFKPSSHLFVAGDLNYRISSRSPPPMADFPSLDPDSENYYPRFFALDQLTRERRAGRTFHGMSEAEVRFPPTYKYDVLPSSGGAGEGEDVVPWKFAPHRWPSWTDRILFLDIPRGVKRRGLPDDLTRMNVRAYDAMPVVRTSDHRAVFLRMDVPLLSAEDMTASAEATDESGDANGVLDPRVSLPVTIDPEAWERRAAVRKREVFTGWSVLLWSTKEGALVIATAVALGIGAWWLVRRR